MLSFYITTCLNAVAFSVVIALEIFTLYVCINLWRIERQVDFPARKRACIMEGCKKKFLKRYRMKNQIQKEPLVGESDLGGSNVEGAGTIRLQVKPAKNLELIYEYRVYGEEELEVSVQVYTNYTLGVKIKGEGRVLDWRYCNLSKLQVTKRRSRDVSGAWDSYAFSK